MVDIEQVNEDWDLFRVFWKLIFWKNPQTLFEKDPH